MEAVRLRLRLRRRLRGSPVLRPRDHQPSAGEPGLQGGNHRPAGLEGREKHHGLRRAAAGILSQRRKHGFHGEPLFRVEKTPESGFLHPRRGHGKAARLRHRGLLQPDPVGLQKETHHHRRHRGQPAPPGALRLLVQQIKTLDSH